MTKSLPRSFQEEHGIIGRSVEIREIVDVVKQVAPTDITVLITGESGVGKEVIAKAIHAASHRTKNPLVTVNSGAIPEGLIESELFGHEKGSFTGASDQRKGYFELADGGTIFLDEIGEIPLPAQVKFLRVLESGEYQRVGSSTPRRVDVRIIAATNKNLQSEVRLNRFRSDLFFRLRSVNIVVPPLRDRKDDISEFVDFFIGDFVAKNNIRFAGMSDQARRALEEYHWPGNVRELRNAVESMLVLENGRFLDADDVRKYLKDQRPMFEDRNLPVHVGKSVEQAERELILRALLDIKGNILELRSILDDQNNVSGNVNRNSLYVSGEQKESVLTLQDMERKMIDEALRRSNGNRRVAARELNISERTLYRKIKEYSLE